MKTFHWPPIGFKDQINEGVKTSKPGIAIHFSKCAFVVMYH
jgi:hypothetical protein